jgi:iron(III) transport system ATP-binding protein
VRNLRKTFASERGVVSAVDDVSFSVESGEFFTLLRPSGCGKSTTLRCVAGLENIDSGTIEIDGRVVASDSRHADANRRPISMVFQSYAIWPHMTVLGNVTFPLSYRGSEGSGRMSGAERRQRGMDALKMVQLEHLADRDAPFLSGGQQQRVALARAGRPAQAAAPRRAAEQPRCETPRGDAYRDKGADRSAGHFDNLCNS